MPAYDLRYIQVAQYTHTDGKTSYGEKVKLGDAMGVNIQFKFAEGRLYAEGRLSEYLKLITGGTISIAEKYIAVAAAKLMYGATEATRKLSGSVSKDIKSLQYKTSDEAGYVGVSFYVPDRIDGKTKYTCMFVAKSLFGPPAYVFKTKGQSIEFQTPTTTGEFLADDGTELLIDMAVCDTVADAKAWCDAVLAPAA